MDVRVRKGDTLSYFSKLFMVPLSLVLDSNQDVDASHLEPGKKIKIPGFSAVPYQVKHGDTFWKLASTRNLDEDAIQALNPQKKTDELQAGETIYLPERIIKSFISTTTPSDYKSLKKVISYLEKAYPFIKVKTVGTSVLGNPIQEIKIGKGKKKVHMNASFHANEWITTVVLLYLVNNYLLSLTNGYPMQQYQAKDFYDEVELSIVPMVNPDGVDLVLNGPPSHLKEEIVAINGGDKEFVHWKANIRGIDLNNQFPANWDICKENKPHKSPASRDFPGDAPLSEPEAIAMADLAKKDNFDCVIAFHTQGEEFYWGYEGFEPEESEFLAKEFERVSGYKAVRYVNSHAGFKDWFIQEFNKPGFTIELGWGINPLPISQLPQIIKHVEGIFLSALRYA